MQHEPISTKFSRKQNELMVMEFRLVFPSGVVIGVEGQESFLGVVEISYILIWVWLHRLCSTNAHLCIYVHTHMYRLKCPYTFLQSNYHLCDFL